MSPNRPPEGDYVPPGGWQPAPLNAPRAQPLGIGVQPGVPNIIRAQLVIVSDAGGGVSGVFVYSGTPGSGNGPFAWMTASSTDPYGNAVTPGVGANLGAIDGGVINTGTVPQTALNPAITARSLGGITTTIAASAPSGAVAGDIWIDSANGYQINQYSGTAWVAVSWTATDVISAGTIDASLIEAGTITASLLAAGIIVAGIVDGTTITGAHIVADGSNGELLIYSGTPAAGNLIGSWSGASGSDSYGNTYPAGVYSTTGKLIFGPSGSPQVILNETATQGQLLFPTGASFENVESAILSAYFPGPPAYLQLVLDGPGINLSGHPDQVYITLNSPNDSGTSSANIGFLYYDGSAYHQYALMDWAGFHVTTGDITGVAPGTGTSPANPAVADTWHSLGSWPVTGWTTVKAQYRWSPFGGVEFDFELIATAAVSGAAAVFPNSLLTGYSPANNRAFPIGLNTTLTSTSNNWPSVEVKSNGQVSMQLPPSNSTATRAGGQFIMYL